MEPPGQSLVPLASAKVIRRKTNPLPALIQQAGRAAGFTWDEFFTAHIRNPHTRTAYRRAISRFLDWATTKQDSLQAITPGMVGHYIDQMSRSPPTKKLHLAALRAFFDLLVTRHVIVLNPAASVRGERYQVIEGKTPEITIEQARKLIASICTDTAVGLRDRAVIGTLIYTAARAGAVAQLRLRDLVHDGNQYLLRFAEKGGKSREIPVRHDLQAFLLDYLKAAGLEDGPAVSPLFRTAVRRTRVLTNQAITGQDVCRMVKRRLKDADLPSRLSPHSFRVYVTN